MPLLVGCNILLDKIPVHARISIVSEGTAHTPREVRGSYNRLRPLEKLQVEKRGWTLDVLQVVQSLSKLEFTLADVYAHSDSLAKLHPRTPTSATKFANNSKSSATSASSNSSAPVPTVCPELVSSLLPPSPLGSTLLPIMPNIESHAPGAFCWVELGTTDQAAAADFYRQIFGWSAKNMPIGPDEVYTMFQLEGRDAAAGYKLRPDQLSRGVPPHWNLYVAVESADATAGRAAQLGGKVLAAPFDVFDAGRMAVLQDPTGATFSLWQPSKNRGTGITASRGTLCWADLSTPDQARAGQFYSDLFGWQIMKEDEDPAHNYWHIKNREEFIGGIPPASHRQPGTPAHWLAYFTVSDCDATAAAAKNLGAKLYMPPTDFENVGRISVMADPQGATFAIFKAAARGAAAS